MTALLTPEEAARRLRVSTKTLRQLRQAGEIRYVAVTERRIFYRPEDCDDFLERRSRLDTPAPRCDARQSVKRAVARTGNVVAIRPFSQRG